jgi:hypothetical protein
MIPKPTNDCNWAYLAGPMTGTPFYNFLEFDRVKEAWNKEGWAIWSPADEDRERGFDPIKNPDIEPSEKFIKDAMRADLDAIQQVHAMVMLNWWEHSKGARAEYALARWRGIPVYDERGLIILDENYREEQLSHDPDPKASEGAKKCPMDLLPPEALRQTAYVLGHGASRYGAWNWREGGVKQTTYVAAIMRHLMAMHEGQWLDPDSDRPHIAHITASAMILLDADNQGKLTR